MALTSSANEWAKTQLDTAGAELRKAEAAIGQFRAQHNAIIEAAPGNSVTVSQQLGHLLNNLNAQFATATQERISAETRVAAAQELINDHRVNAIPDVLSSPLIQQLRVEEARTNAQLAASDSTLGAKHPTRKALSSELGRLRASIDSNVNQIVSNLQAKARDARAREEELASKMEALRKDVGDASQQQLQLSILERRAEGRRTFYAALEKRYSETSALMHGVYPDARIVSRATPQPLASWPNIPIVLASGLLLGAAIGAAIVALLELADKTLSNASAVGRNQRSRMPRDLARAGTRAPPCGQWESFNRTNAHVSGVGQNDPGWAGCGDGGQHKPGPGPRRIGDVRFATRRKDRLQCSFGGLIGGFRFQDPPDRRGFAESHGWRAFGGSFALANSEIDPGRW